ncbi:MAG TPA: flagellar motor protein MotB [Verrucomicrobiae bacterium]
MSRKKKGHGHHGGAWKVAYADFVTAMMALFLVLWLTSQDEKIKEAVERSFKNPFNSLTKDSTGLIPSKDAQAVRSSSGNFDSASAMELNMLRKLAQDLVTTLQTNEENPEENPIKMDISPEGMKISVFDKTRRAIFEPDSAKFTEYGQWVFSTLAWQLSRYTSSFNVELEGHTETGRPQQSENYSDWEMTADRANAARRELLKHGVTTEQIRKVAGYADTQPLTDRPSTDAGNRRVTVMLRIKSGNRSVPQT